MQGNGVLASIGIRFAGRRRWRLVLAGLQMLERFLYCGGETNRAAPFVRGANNVQRMQANLVIASLPCWFIGLWNTGYQSSLALDNAGTAIAAGWRASLLGSLGVSAQADDLLGAFLLGLLYFLPLFLLVLLVGAFWNALFSVLRQRTPDEGLLAFAWLFTLFLPAGAASLPVVLAVSFGLVLGKHIYGGSGFYLVNPVVVGLVFLWLAYPSVPNPGTLMPPSPQAIDAAWWAQFVGIRPGNMGTTSVLGCVIGAMYLFITRSTSWRIVLGALLGTGLAAAAADQALLQTLVGGGLVFGLVFLAPDPVAASITNSGRWAFGMAVGVLAIVLQQGNAAVGESVLFAVFVASLLAPLIDAAVIAVYRRRRRRQGGALHGQA